MLAVRPKTAFFVSAFLRPTCTFIYRQLQGISKEFSPIVLAETRQHEELFPFEGAHVKPRSGVSLSVASAMRAIRFPGNRYSATRNQLRYWEDVLRREDARLIHANFGPGGLAVLPLAKRLNIPLLVSFHGYDASSLLRKRPYRKSLPYLFEYAHVVAVSEHMRRRLISHGANPDRIARHYYGIPNCRLVNRKPMHAKLGSHETTILFQGSNFVEKKGHAYTIAAFSKLSSNNQNIRLRLAGDGPLRPQMEELAKELGVQNKIDFLGHLPIDRISEQLTMADLYVHHSVIADNGDEEGVPNAILEAMGTGLPVVATKHAGIPEIITHGKTGFLVEERNTEQYVSVLQEAISSSYPVGRSAHEFVRKHLNQDRQDALLREIYNRTLAKQSLDATSL